MCKYSEQLTPFIETDFDPCRRVGRPIHSRQAVPALPDPFTVRGFPCPANLGNTRLKPPVSR